MAETHNSDDLTLAVLIYERAGTHTLWLSETAKGYRLNDELQLNDVTPPMLG